MSVVDQDGDDYWLLRQLLFPQYDKLYVNDAEWEELQEEAQRRIDEGGHEFVNKEVLARWKSIVAGVVPDRAIRVSGRR